MRYLLHSLLIIAALFAGQASVAQKTAIAPIEPRQPMVQPVAPVVLGKNVWPTSRTFLPLVRPSGQPEPIFLLNSAVIIGESLANINPTDIKTLMVYKGQDAPEQWRSLAAHGIIDITLKNKRAGQVKSHTLAEIGKWFSVMGPASYTINGMPVTGTSLRIATEAIGEVKVQRATLDVPSTLVAIQIAPRLPETPKPNPTGPPRIFIRGTAAL